MSAVSNWAAPYLFRLTNPYNGLMTLNTQTDEGLYLLVNDACKFNIGVRATKADVPQSNGSILHKRFLTGADIQLVVQLWENANQPACNEILQHMNDELTGALRSLLNAVDNEGRLAWDVAGEDDRMLEDIRLLVYPSDTIEGGVTTITATIDSKYPYAETETQETTSIAAGTSEIITNLGTAENFPVMKVYGPIAFFEITNLTTGEVLTYDGVTIPGSGQYAELNCFNNTIYLNGDGADLLAGIDIPNSLFPQIIPGENEIQIDGAAMDVLWNHSWA